MHSHRPPLATLIVANLVIAGLVIRGKLLHSKVVDSSNRFRNRNCIPACRTKIDSSLEKRREKDFFREPVIRDEMCMRAKRRCTIGTPEDRCDARRDVFHFKRVEILLKRDESSGQTIRAIKQSTTGRWAKTWRGSTRRRAVEVRGSVPVLAFLSHGTPIEPQPPELNVQPCSCAIEAVSMPSQTAKAV